MPLTPFEWKEELRGKMDESRMRLGGKNQNVPY